MTDSCRSSLSLPCDSKGNDLNVRRDIIRRNNRQLWQESFDQLAHMEAQRAGAEERPLRGHCLLACLRQNLDELFESVCIDSEIGSGVATYNGLIEFVFPP